MVEEGKEILQRKMRHAKIAYTDDEINKLQKFFNYKTSQELFLNFQSGVLDASDLKKYVDGKGMISNLLQKFRKTPKQEFVAPEPASDLDMIVLVRTNKNGLQFCKMLQCTSWRQNLRIYYN